MISEDRVVKLFLELCAINSPSLKEGECAAFIVRRLKEIGLEPVEDDAGRRIGGTGNNIVATLPGNVPGAPRIFLSAHMDTVEPTEGLVVQETDGVFTSAGDTILGADDKAGIAPVIEAAQALIESGEPHGDVVLLFTVSEESGLRGAECLDLKALNLDFGYVLDTSPPVGDFVTHTGTHDYIDAVIHGKAAHSGKEPEKGISAIQVMADAVSKMTLGRISPNTTANIGIVEGGSAVNVVCPEVRLRSEVRSSIPEELERQVDHMIQELERAARAWGATVEVDHGRHYEGYVVPDDSPVVKVGLAASRSLGFVPNLRMTLGGSDANVFNAQGLPSVVMACGMDRAHTHEERTTRADLVNAARLVYATVVEAARTAAL